MFKLVEALRDIRRSEFARNMVMLVTGTTIAQAIPLAISPLLSRLYLPEDFSTFGIYFSIFSILTVIAAGRFEYTIILPKKDEDGVNLAGAGAMMAFVFSLLVLVVVLLFNSQIADLLNNPGIRSWLFIIPLALLIISFNRLLNYWLTRRKGYKYISTGKVGHRLAEAGGSLGLGAIALSNGLIIGDLVGRVVLLFISIKFAIKKGFAFNSITWESVKRNAKRYKDFPLYNSVPAFLNTCSSHFPIFIISAYYGEEITGHFNFTRVILAAPIALISVNISQIMIQRISDRRNNGQKVSGELKYIFIRLAAIAIAMSAVVGIWGEDLFTFVFGDKWMAAGEYATILVFSFAIQFAVSPLSSFFPAMEKIKIASVWQIIYFLVIMSLFFWENIGIKNFLFIYASLEIGVYVLYGLLIWWQADKYDRTLSQ